jgi:hypothetical protein
MLSTKPSKQFRPGSFLTSSFPAAIPGASPQTSSILRLAGTALALGPKKCAASLCTRFDGGEPAFCIGDTTEVVAKARVVCGRHSY